jgi:branched-chain amino acid aminotransferase
MTVASTANVDGVITLLAEARIPVADRGFLYGDSIYEVFRTYSGVPLLYREHWKRMENSARLIHMEIPYTAAGLFEEIRRAIDSSGAAQTGEDVYVRFTITRGDGPVDLYPQPELPSRFVIMVKPVPVRNPEFYTTGVTLAIPAVRRNPSNALDPNIKGGNYLNNVIGVIEAKALGADDCLFLNDQGLATESSNSNVFFVIADRLVTPYQSAGNLIGLTKETLLRLGRENGIETVESAVGIGDMREGTECFITSATREIMPVKSLKLQSGEIINFPAGGGPLTLKMSAFYQAFLRNYVQEHQAERLY